MMVWSTAQAMEAVLIAPPVQGGQKGVRRHT